MLDGQVGSLLGLKEGVHIIIIIIIIISRRRRG